MNQNEKLKRFTDDVIIRKRLAFKYLL